MTVIELVRKTLAFHYQVPLSADAYNSLHGTKEALDKIHQLMDGEEWSSDTLGEIAQVLRHVGYKIRDYNELTQEEA